MKTNVCVLGAVLAAGFASSASAGVLFYFANITANNVADAAAGEAQLSVMVSDVGGGQVSFLFSNSGPAPMSITDVYFDDGSLLGIASITNGPGVDFSQGAAPPNLPGGNSISPPFITSAGFSADSNPPAQPNGVNPGEFLIITFDLIGGKTFADVIHELSTSNELRIGIHVQGFAGGGSESFVTPAPGALGLLGFAGVLAARRRR